MIPKVRIILALAVLILALPSPASAHADLVQSYPVAGNIYPIGTLSQVSLKFDEAIEPSFSSVEVYSNSLERMDVGEIQLDPTDEHILLVNLSELEPDTYTVIWTVVSIIDGHSTTGLYTFVAGSDNDDNVPLANSATISSDPTLRLWEVGIRWLLFSSAFIIFGAFLLTQIVFEERFKAAKIEFRDLWSEVNRSKNSLIYRALFFWLLAGLGLLIFQSLVIGRKGLLDVLMDGIPMRLLTTRFGLIWIIRQLFALGLLVLHRNKPNSYKVPKLFLAAGLLGSLSLSSHNAAGALWPLMSTIVDWLHLLANGAWIGGLLALTMSFIPALRCLPPDERLQVVVPTLQRFSPLALGSVIVAFVTGVFSASLHFLTPDDIIGTTYGKTLLIKLTLAILVLFFGLANTLALKSNLQQRLMPFNRKKDRWRRKLTQRVKIETLIGLLILLTTALLTALPTPPPQPIPEGQQLPSNSGLREIYLPGDQIKVFFTLAPNWTGWNRYLLVLQDDHGNPISDAERVRLRFYLPEADARTDWLTAVQTQDGLYLATGQELVLVGEWQIEIDIRRIDIDDVRFSVVWSMESPPAFVVDPAQPRPANWLALTLCSLCIMGLIYWNYRNFPGSAYSKNHKKEGE